MIKVIGHAREAINLLGRLERVETHEIAVDCFTGTDIWNLGRFKDNMGRLYKEVVQYVLFDGKGNASYFLGYQRESDNEVFGWKLTLGNLPKTIVFTYDTNKITLSNHPDYATHYVMSYKEAVEIRDVLQLIE